MNADRLLNTFLELVQIDSPSQHEAAMAQRCSEKLRALGFEVHTDSSQEETGSDTGSVIAHRAATNGGVGRLAFSSHMDCVQPCVGINPVVKDDAVYSDGTTILSSDDKSGIAQILEGIESADESQKPVPELWVLFSTCEEIGCKGAIGYPEGVLPEGTLCLVLDSGGHIGTIISASPYKWSFTARYKGVAAHAGVSPEAGKSAIQMAAHAMEAMPLGRLDEQTTSNVGTIKGGSAENVVPEFCELVGECRSLDEARVLEVKEQINEALLAGAAAFEGEVEIDWKLGVMGYNLSEDDADIVLLQNCIRAAGFEAKLESTGGASDANVLVQKGAKALLLSTGMENYHTTDEYITLADLNGGAVLVEEVLLTVGTDK